MKSSACFSTACFSASANTLSISDHIQTLSSMKIQSFTVGMLSTNCYVVSCPETSEAIVIDPGFEADYEAEQVIRYVDKNSLKVKFIVNTHGHADHL